MSELTQWNKVKATMNYDNVILGKHYSSMLKEDPKKLLFMLSHYKFAAKLIGTNKHILEVGCSEGIGTALLADPTNNITAVDFDQEALTCAIANFNRKNIIFSRVDFLKIILADVALFDAFVAFDVVEHIYPKNQARFFKNISKILFNEGICIIGTPNILCTPYASKTSQIGHVNLYSWEKLKLRMEKYFKNVFMFSANDEVIHTGFYPMAHYLIAVGIGKKGIK